MHITTKDARDYIIVCQCLLDMDMKESLCGRMCQKMGEPCVYMYVSVETGATQSTPQTLLLDWAVLKCQSALEHHKDRGAQIVHHRLYQRWPGQCRHIKCLKAQCNC